MTMLQKCACVICKRAISLVVENANHFNWAKEEMMDVLGGHPWTFSDIMPCVVWHDDSTKEYGEDAT